MSLSCILLTDYPKTQNRPLSYNIINFAMIHEMVHCFGMAGHCEKDNCIMYKSNDYNGISDFIFCNDCIDLVENNIFKLYNHGE